MSAPFPACDYSVTPDTAERPIYLDYNATTPCDPRVIEVMMPYLTHHFGNPHSRSHTYGWQAEDAVKHARSQVAHSIGADTKDIVFTSGATEANNLAIKGAVRFFDKNNKKPDGATKGHVITIVTEHKCVLETMRSLEQDGFSVSYLPVQPSGLVCLDTLKNAMRPDTIMVSIGAVNGEIGVIQPIQAIGQLCRQQGVLFHTDAAQALGKIHLDVNAMNIDLLSLSSHKIYGPKGIGALYVRRKPRVRIMPLFNGGGQERGLRSGTLAPFLCVGFGCAAEIAATECAMESARLLRQRQQFLNTLEANIECITLNGHKDQRVAGNLNISFKGVEGESLIMALGNLAVSSGSACTSESLEPSYVLQALGVGDESHTSLRIGLGRFTTDDDVTKAADTIIQAVQRLRDLSPLWDMYKAGIDLNTIQWSHH